MIKFLILVAITVPSFLADPQESGTSASGCSISVDRENLNLSPLLIDMNGNLIDLERKINENETLWITCPGGSSLKSLNLSIDLDGELIVCDANDTFQIQGNKVKYSSITCTLDETKRPSLNETNGSSCESGGTISTIGYIWRRSNSFLPTYTACINSHNSLTFYVKYNISRIAYIPTNYTACSTIKSFDGSISPVYNKSHTQHILNNLGYGFEDLDPYLEEGQLASESDFYNPFQKDATSCYVNVAPQWNTFKDGNWAHVQKSITTFLSDKNYGDVIAYSGTLGISGIEDKNKGGLATLNLELPVPRWFWKIIYSPQNQTGNIILGYNNPYAAKYNVDSEFMYTVCLVDRLESLSWLKNDINNEDPEHGFTYGCLFHEILDTDLLQVVNNLLSGIDKHNITSFQ